MTLEQLLKKLGKRHEVYLYNGANKEHLPCFAHRWTVTDAIDDDATITAYVREAAKKDTNDVLVFSVTQRDKCWGAWLEYAKAHPRKFKVVEGGSIHGRYLCRMYIYTKPKSQQKFKGTIAP